MVPPHAATAASLATPPLTAARAAFAAHVRHGLTAPRKRLDPQYLYDPLGSALFDAICELPWYHVTRAERRLLDAHAGELAARLRDRVQVVELGPGSGAKLSRLLSTPSFRARDVRVHLIDVSRAALTAAADATRRAGASAVSIYEGTFGAGLDAWRGEVAPDTSVLALFLGSNIGNFDPTGAQRLLRDLRAALPAGGALLLGADLVKPERDLVLAYDDPLGVTAAFNRNLLARINRELGGEFDLARFVHRACWNAGASRVEMHLVATAACDVAIEAAECRARFAAGETVWTEASYKYEPEGLVRAGREAGLAARAQWIDRPGAFALTLFAAD